MLKKLLFSFIVSLISLALVAGWVSWVLHVEDEAAPASLPSFYITSERSAWDRGYVTASGTWVMELPDVMANPIRTSKIVCIYADKICREATAEFTHLFSKQLNIHVDIHDVVKWDSDQIVYVNDEAICNVYFYYLNRVTKQVTGVRKSKKDAPKDICDKYTDNEIRLKLADGFDVYWAAKQGAMSPFARMTPIALLLLAFLFSIWFIWKRLGK